MPKLADMRHKGLFSVPDILEQIKRIYKITNDYDDISLLKYIRRYINNNKKYVCSDNSHYVDKKFVDRFFTDKKVQKHLAKIGNRTTVYKTAEQLELEAVADGMETLHEDIKKQEQAGITNDDSALMFFDEADEAHRYLTVDELIAVNRKGLTRKNELTDTELQALMNYNSEQRLNSQNQMEIDRLFKEKKFEIMLTALFEDKFLFYDKELKEDIEKYVCYKDLTSEFNLSDIHNYFEKKT